MNLIVYAVVWIGLSILGDHLMGYSLAKLFGDASGWYALTGWIRYPIALVLWSVILTVTLIVFVVAQVVPTPLF